MRTSSSEHHISIPYAVWRDLARILSNPPTPRRPSSRRVTSFRPPRPRILKLQLFPQPTRPLLTSNYRGRSVPKRTWRVIPFTEAMGKTRRANASARKYCRVRHFVISPYCLAGVITIVFPRWTAQATKAPRVPQCRRTFLRLTFEEGWHVSPIPDPGRAVVLVAPHRVVAHRRLNRNLSVLRFRRLAGGRQSHPRTGAHCRTAQPGGGHGPDRGPRDSRATIPSLARKTIRLGPDGVDAPDHDVPRGGDTFHAAGKPHGGLSRIRTRRCFVRIRCCARLGIPDVRGSSPPAYASFQGKRGLLRQASNALISQIPPKEKRTR